MKLQFTTVTIAGWFGSLATAARGPHRGRASSMWATAPPRTTPCGLWGGKGVQSNADPRLTKTGNFAEKGKYWLYGCCWLNITHEKVIYLHRAVSDNTIFFYWYSQSSGNDVIERQWLSRQGWQKLSGYLIRLFQAGTNVSNNNPTITIWKYHISSTTICPDKANNSPLQSVK